MFDWKLGDLNEGTVDGTDCVMQAAHITLAIPMNRFPFWLHGFGSEVWDYLGTLKTWQAGPVVDKLITDSLSVLDDVDSVKCISNPAGRNSLHTHLVITTNGQQVEFDLPMPIVGGTTT